MEDIPYSIAARLVTKLTGVAKAQAQLLGPKSLRPKEGIEAVPAVMGPGGDADGGPIEISPEVPAVPKDWLHGVNLLMATLKDGMQLDLQSEKGFEMKRFYKDPSGDRRSHEPMADYIVRFQES